MKIALDISPLQNKNFLQHRVRGTGFYTRFLKESLENFFPDQEYLFFEKGQSLPSNVDVIHIPYFEPFFLTVPFSNLQKTIITIHDLTPLVFAKEFPVGLKGRFRWEIQKRLLRQVKSIITDSENSKKDIVKITGIAPEKVHVVYLAASERFRVIKNNHSLIGIKKKFDLPEKFILYVGDVTWNKNLPFFIKTVMRLQMPLVMVGSALMQEKVDRNPWNKDLIELKQLVSDTPWIKLLGFVSQDELIAMYNLATVFCMPSLYEGFGLPILEAMNCGCAVVTSGEGSLKEVAGDGAYYIDPRDSKSLEEGLRLIFSDSALREKLIRNGFLQSKKFTWEKTSTKTMEVYKL